MDKCCTQIERGRCLKYLYVQVPSSSQMIDLGQPRSVQNILNIHVDKIVTPGLDKIIT